MSEEKEPIRAQIFRYFGIEIRNNNLTNVYDNSVAQQKKSGFSLYYEKIAFAAANLGGGGRWSRRFSSAMRPLPTQRVPLCTILRYPFLAF